MKITLIRMDKGGIKHYMFVRGDIRIIGRYDVENSLQLQMGRRYWEPL